MAQQTEAIPKIEVEPLSDAEIKQGLQALEQARILRSDILKRRGGKPLPSSWRLIREEREERSNRL